MSRLALTFLSLAGLAAAAVDITALNKNVSATSGTGAVSAAGTLEPFGGVGVGCGINWAEGESYGGGFPPFVPVLSPCRLSREMGGVLGRRS